MEVLLLMSSEFDRTQDLLSLKLIYKNLHVRRSLSNMGLFLNCFTLVYRTLPQTASTILQKIDSRFNEEFLMGAFFLNGGLDTRIYILIRYIISDISVDYFE